MLEPELERRLLANPSSTAVLTDFDGTLAPIVVDPKDARPLPDAARVLTSLSEHFAVVAVISGRPVEFLSTQLEDAGTRVRLFGGYGTEWIENGVARRAPELEEWTPRAQEALHDARRHAPQGLGIEEKASSVTLHWRNAPQHEAWAEEFARRWSARSGFVLRPGRMAIELGPSLGIDKGRVVEQLATGCSAACFAGDDAGDIAAFDALRRLASRGLDALCIAVADEESPTELVEKADLVLGGPFEALGLFSDLARGAGATESAR